MASGHADYAPDITFPLSVNQGGSGVATLTLNGVLLGNGTSPLNVSAAGLANQVFQVPSGGGAPIFQGLHVDASSITGIVPVANGGTGTATPALVAGAGISLSGTWPNVTITNSSAYATLADPLPVAHGGTGTATPALVAGANISLSGSWPGETVALVASPSITNLSASGYVHAEGGAIHLDSDVCYIQTVSLVLGGTATREISGGAEWLSIQSPTAAREAISCWVGTDTEFSWGVQANGFMEWGPGGAGNQDIALFRNSAGNLQIQSFHTQPSDHKFSVNDDTTNGATGPAIFRVDNSVTPHLVNVDNGARLVVNGAGGGAGVDVVGVSGGNAIRGLVPTTADTAYVAGVSGDAHARYAVIGSGEIDLGSGSAAHDLAILRAAALQVNINGIGGEPTFGVGQSTDTQSRVALVAADPSIKLGPGNAAADITLIRAAAGELHAIGSVGLGVVATSADTVPRILLDTANNRISFGPGNAGVDTFVTHIAGGGLNISGGKVVIGSGKINISLLIFASNAAAVTGGLAAGDFYRDGGDPDHVCVVH